MDAKKTYLTATLTTLLAWPLHAAAQPSAASRAVAIVGGAAIAESEVAARAQLELQRIEEQRLEVLGEKLDEMIEGRLLDLDAKQRGISAGELLRLEVTAKVVEPATGEVDAFYEGGKAGSGRSKEEMAPQIRTYLLNQRRQAAKAALLASLRSKYGVRNLLQEEREALAATRAASLRQLVESSDAPSLGPAAAPVTVVEFSDFECPFCGRVVPTLKQLAASFGDQVRVVYRHFPLTGIHRHAQKAAEASLCAAEQGKFWEYHDLLFQEQQKLAVGDLEEKARRVGLDVPRFASCLGEGAMVERVRRDAEAGSQAGVTGTPALLVNGRLIEGAVPYEQLAQAVQEEVDRQAAKPAAQ
jgi:protein-disulfide isomerase